MFAKSSLQQAQKEQSFFYFFLHTQRAANEKEDFSSHLMRFGLFADLISYEWTFPLNIIIYYLCLPFVVSDGSNDVRSSIVRSQK